MRWQFIFLSALLFSACNQSSESRSTAETTTSEKTENGSNVKASTSSWEQLKMYSFRDQSGNVVAEMPFPESWDVAENHAKGEPTITGPYQTRITDYPIQIFMNVTDPRLQQAYYQSGQQMRAMPGIEELIQQDIAPWCAQYGYNLVKYYEVPEVSKADKWYSDQLYKAVPSEGRVVAIGTDWQTSDGKPYFLLLHLSVSNTAEMQNWSYWSSGLEADPEYFDRAKKQLLFSLASVRYALEPIAEYNQREAQKAGASWAAHNQRMAQNQAAFEAQQRAFVNKSNAINDAIMNGWRERNASSDRQHEQFVDVITERTKVTNSSTGQTYKVQSGYNQYWMNSNGEYISTNQSDYNPNLDDAMNNQRWEELKEVKY